MRSSLPPAVRAQLEETFRAEAADRMGEMAAALADDGDVQDHLDALFRHAHSIKGAAAAIGRAEVAELAHDFESRLEAARSGDSEIDREQVQAMLDDLGHAIDPPGGEDDGDHGAAASQHTTSSAVGTSPSETAQPAGPASEAPPPAPAAAAPDGPVPAATPVDELVRVGARGLDTIAADVGDLALTADEWRRLASEAGSLAKRLATAVRATAGGPEQQIGSELAGLARSIREQSHRTDRLVESVGRQLQTVRMEPIDALLNTVAREARRLARQLDHAVDVEVEGFDVQADRRVIARLRDPLLHLVRNAVDHGGQPEEERRAQDKPATLMLRISATTVGSSLLVMVSDDGRGIDTDAMRATAIERGLEVDHLDEDGIRGLIFAPGFTTARSVTDVSGRGVGLAAVRQEVESLFGSVQVTSEPGEGSTFRITVPQGISGVRCLVVEVAGRLLAVPVSGVLTIRALTESVTSRVGGRAVMVFDGVARTIVSASALVGGADDDAARFGVVVVHAGRTCVLAVDDLVSQVNLVVKQLPPILGDLEGVSGAAVLGDGTVVPVLLPSALVDLDTGMVRPARVSDVSDEVGPPRLLVVDDSSTTRTLIRTILTASGFEVETATDGAQGLELLRADAHDLVVSDIEMPGLDGFDLTRAIRADPGLAATPVVLVSSRADADDRAESAAAGADVHIDKGAFDQGQLVSVIRDLLG